MMSLGSAVRPDPNTTGTNWDKHIDLYMDQDQRELWRL